MHLDVLDLLDQVGGAGANIVWILRQQVGWQGLPGDDLELAAVRLESTDGGDQDGRIGNHARRAALDVEEALGPHVGSEAGLGDQVVAAALADEVADDAAVAVSNVAEGAGMHDDGCVLQRLQQVRLQCFLHDDGHRASGMKLLGGDRIAVLRVADHDATHTSAHVVQRSGEGEDGHDLGGSGDVETGLTSDAIHLAAEADDDVAQAAIVDVEHAAPCDVVDIEAELVALVKMVVDHRRQQVVCCGDGVEVAREVQVEQLHRDHLAVAATGSATLDAERWAHAGLAQADHSVLADVRHGLAQTHRRGGLAFAQRSGRDGCDHDVLGLRAIAQLSDGLQLDLGQVVAVLFEQVWADAHFGGDVIERSWRCSASDLKVGRERHGSTPLRFHMGPNPRLLRAHLVPHTTR